MLRAIIAPENHQARMREKYSLSILSALLAIALAPLPLHAEIYKWKDAEGKTHYSDNKVEADKARAEVLAVQTAPSSAPGRTAAHSWELQNAAFNRREAQRRIQESRQAAPAPKKPSAFVPGDQAETDVSRCALGREILSGTVRHSNYAPIDRNDREIAARDIKTYCR